MQSRRAKNGCRQCKDIARSEEAKRQFEEQARLEREREQELLQLLNQDADALHQDHDRLRDLLLV